MEFVVGVLAGFGFCSLLTFKLLTSKAKAGLRPVIDKDGSIYWQQRILTMSEHITDEILLQENASLKQAIMLCAKDFGIDPGDYLHDVLTRDAIGELIDDDTKETDYE